MPRLSVPVTVHKPEAKGFIYQRHLECGARSSACAQLPIDHSRSDRHRRHSKANGIINGGCLGKAVSAASKLTPISSNCMHAFLSSGPAFLEVL
jgi:hypothetical protein